ncbi:hypothetical protein SEA_OPIA_93 [Mycobacterium phage Opia]|uniref:Uncharacterized protein n=1 Tax=Mycobacterium phage Opia TaxID=2079422 RepID=A0A2L1IYZ8_9CAUD|nr:hypothetical protein SEA_OPIA_93 [Mycobacterium phage Opia]QYC54336.1 hypothetical protein SEA_ALLEGRO_92 [Mycobacterium phage Allegro]
MAAKFTFTVDLPNGEVATRTSGTMPYIAATIIVQADGEAFVHTWHKSSLAAEANARTGYGAKRAQQLGGQAIVVPVRITAVAGKLGDWHPEVDGWGEIAPEAFAEVVAAKAAPKAAPKVATGADVLASAVEAATEEDKAEATVETPKFRSHKGGEYRAEVAGVLYRVVRKTVTEFAAQRKTAAGWEDLGTAGDRAAAEAIVATKAAGTKLAKNQVVRDGKIVWRNSGEAHNAYRRARRAALKAAREAAAKA